MPGRPLRAFRLMASRMVRFLSMLPISPFLRTSLNRMSGV